MREWHFDQRLKLYFGLMKVSSLLFSIIIAGCAFGQADNDVKGQQQLKGFTGAFGTNAADCAIENMTANRGNVSVANTTAFTISNITAGDVVAYHCIGR